MIWKLIVALAAVFSGVQQPVTEPLVFNGIPLNIIPEQCPVPHFQEQCLADEITRANAQKALSDIPEARNTCLPLDRVSTEMAKKCVQKRFKKYDKATLQRVYNYLHAHGCKPQDHATIESRSTIVGAIEERLTIEEVCNIRAKDANSKRYGLPCNSGARWESVNMSKKKFQKLLRRMQNQERNQNAAAE